MYLHEKECTNVVHALNVAHLVVIAAVGFEKVEKLVLTSIKVLSKQILLRKCSKNILANQICVVVIVHFEKFAVHARVMISFILLKSAEQTPDLASD